MKAQLVFDGTTFTLPNSQGTPSLDQDQGTVFERLGELSSRVCYQSYGVDKGGKRKGRSSKKLHEHILEVKNHSVYEHATFTISFDSRSGYDFLRSLINRKGIWVELVPDGIEVTANLRAILEWDRHTKPTNRGSVNESIRDTFLKFGSELAPNIVNSEHWTYPMPGSLLKTTNLSDDQASISMWMEGSRGWSHEQVRHRFAMSQRSTRYVDESESPYVTHPLISKYLEDSGFEKREALDSRLDHSTVVDRGTYKYVVEVLETYLIDRGVEKVTARKQSRGAARGYLGNALSTEMIFTAPISGWKWILSQRLSAKADQEIRGIMVDVLSELRRSAYGNRFTEFVLIPSPDGIGQVLEGT